MLYLRADGFLPSTLRDPDPCQAPCAFLIIKMKGQVREFQLDAHTTVRIDWSKLERYSKDLKGNIALGLVGGVLAGGAAVGIWTAVAALTGQLGTWMVLAVGVLVGLGVRALGRGITPVFSLMGASLAVLACLLGDVCVTLIATAQQAELPLSQLIATLDVRALLERLLAGFQPMDLLFYAFAVYQGSDRAVRRIKDEELANLICKT